MVDENDLLEKISRPISTSNSSFEQVLELATLVGFDVAERKGDKDLLSADQLSIPVRLASAKLSEHRRKCKDAHCKFFPPSLNRFRTYRPEKIKSDISDEICKALQTESTHSFVKAVKKDISAKYAETASRLKETDDLDLAWVCQNLRRGGETGREILAALWATDTLERHGGLLRLLLVAKRPHGIRSAKQSDHTTERDLDEARSSLRHLQKQIRKLQTERDDAVKEAQAKDKNLSQKKQELHEANVKIALAAEKDQIVNDRLEDVCLKLEDSEKKNTQLEQMVKAVSVDLKSLQQRIFELEANRSSVTAQLSGERSRAEKLERELDEQPRGPAAVHFHLLQEVDRLNIEKTIASGGTRERAASVLSATKKLLQSFEEIHPSFHHELQRPQLIKPRAELYFQALGGSAEVGRSSYLVAFGEHRVLVDCGIKPGAKDDEYPDIAGLNDIRAVIVTHAHTDHIGWLPALIRNIGEKSLYCSRATAALLPVMLEDCRRHYVVKQAKQKERARFSRSEFKDVDAYDEKDVALVTTLVVDCLLREKTGISRSDLAVTLFHAGHILGATSALIEDSSGRRVLMTGDISSVPQLTVQQAAWPDDIGDIDLLVLESTYGDTNHPEAEASRTEFFGLINETVSGGGSVIVPSFGLGRAQEILSLIDLARSRGIIDAKTPVHVDGMIREINPIYRNNGALSFAEHDFNTVSGQAERDEIIYSCSNRPAIIVTTSGMLTGGPVINYAQRLLPDPRHRMILTGYQDEGAPTKALLDISQGRGRRVVKLTDDAGEVIQFEAAAPARKISLSAHADQQGLLRYASLVKPKTIVLVHGEPHAQKALASRLRTVHPRAEILCGPLEKISID